MRANTSGWGSGTPSLVDTHCHVDLFPDFEAVVEEAETGRIVTVAVTNTPSVFKACARIVAGRRFVRPALGLHPELAHERHAEMPLFRDLLSATRFVGEVGLDYTTTDERVRETQRRVFGEVLANCAGYGDRILTVHSRRAERDVVDMIGAGYEGTVILHWFTGSRKVLDDAVRNDLYFSVNPAMTRSRSGREVIAALPPERVLTESDGPFATSRSGQGLRPAGVKEATEFLATQWSVPSERAQAIVYENFRRLYRKATPDRDVSGG